MKKIKHFSIISAVMVFISLVLMCVQPKPLTSVLFAGIGMIFLILALIELENKKGNPNRFIDTR